jgi:hypothetical protein
MDPDPTPFFTDFKDVINFFFKLKIFFLLKICVKILFGRDYFSLLNTFMRIGKDPDPEPKPDPDPFL